MTRRPSPRASDMIAAMSVRMACVGIDLVLLLAGGPKYVERKNKPKMQGGYTRRSTRTIPLPIYFSLSCFNKEPATGGSGLNALPNIKLKFVSQKHCAHPHVP